MKKHITPILILILFLGVWGDSYAQQLPIFTQYPSDELFFNPAMAGTKRMFDIRLNYRNQWVGMPDAPITEGVSLNYRVPNGKMGFAGYIYQDVTGPTQINDYTLCYAYHVKFPDLVMSIGLAGSMLEYTVRGSQLTIHQQNDPAIDLGLTSQAWTPEASAGVYLYNDRFQLGLSVDNMAEQSENLFKKYKPDTTNVGIVQLEPHFFGYLSYSFSGSGTPDYVWQNSLFAVTSVGTPMYLDYSLRLHIHNKVYVGADYSIGNSLSLDLGITFHDIFQVAYSYDLITSPISAYTSGSQEVTLILSFNALNKRGVGGDDRFLKRKYAYMF